jgi:hypothetical protein
MTTDLRRMNRKSRALGVDMNSGDVVLSSDDLDLPGG